MTSLYQSPIHLASRSDLLTIPCQAGERKTEKPSACQQEFVRVIPGNGGYLPRVDRHVCVNLPPRCRMQSAVFKTAARKGTDEPTVNRLDAEG